MGKFSKKIAGLLFGLALTFGVGISVAHVSSSVETHADTTLTYTHTFASGEITAKAQSSKELDKITWSISEAKYVSFDSTNGKGLQLGSSGSPQTSDWTMSTPISSFGTGAQITEISATLSTASKGGIAWTFTAGSVSDGGLVNAMTTPTAKSVAFDNISSGNVTIALNSNSKSKAIYIKDITIKYTKVYATSVSLSSDDFSIKDGAVDLKVGDGSGTVVGTLVATVLPENALDKTVTWTSDSDNCYVEDGEVAVDTSETGTYTVTATANGSDPSGSAVTDTVTFNVIDASAPVLTSVTVGGTPTKATQYVGQSFDPSGLTFTPVYDEEASNPDTINGAELTWSTLVAGKNPTASYTSKNYSGTVTITVTSVDVIDDYVKSVSLSGSMSKTTYSVGDSWDTDGLVVKAKYASDEANEVTVTEGITWTHNPATINSTSITSVTTSATFGGVTSDSITTNVTVNEKVYASGIVDGAKYIIEATFVNDKNPVGPFVLPCAESTSSAPKGVLGTGASFASDLSKAWTFTSTGVDDQWKIHCTIDKTEYYLYHTNSNNGVRVNTEAYADDQGWLFNAKLVGEDKLVINLQDSTNSRYLTAYSTPDFRCYTNTTTQGSGSATITLTKYKSYDSLTASAAKTSGWHVGDNPSLSDLGATVTANFGDGTTSDVTSSASITSGLPLTKGSNTLVVSYTIGSVTHTANIDVNDVTQLVTGVSMNSYNNTMDLEATQNLSVTITPEDADNKAITWTSSDTSIATVIADTSDSSKATVTASATNTGSVTITATTSDGSKKSCTATINVIDPNFGVESIKISGTLAKSEYYSGQTFDPTGLTVTAVYNDDSEVDVTSSVSWTPNPLTAGTTYATATYTCDDGTFTDTISITVVDRTLQSLEKISDPTNTTYIQGATSLDLTGFKVTAHYQYDDEDVTSSCVLDDYDLNELGSQTVTASFGGKSVEFDIYVTVKIQYNASVSGYYKVSDASTLKAGDKLLIATNAATTGTTYAVATDFVSGKDFLGYANATVSGDKITPSSEFAWTLGGQAGAWTLSNSSSEKLGATKVKGLAYDSGTTTWTISIADGVTAVTSTTSSYGSIKYNTQSPRFLNYASGQADIALYRYETRQVKTDYVVTKNICDAVNAANECFSCTGDSISWADGKSWTDVTNAFNILTNEEKAIMKVAISNKSGNFVEQFIAKYDIITVKYSATCADFLGRNASTSSNSLHFNASNNSNDSLAVSLVFVISGLTVIGGLFFIGKSKRKHNK